MGRSWEECVGAVGACVFRDRTAEALSHNCWRSSALSQCHLCWAGRCICRKCLKLVQGPNPKKHVFLIHYYANAFTCSGGFFTSIFCLFLPAEHVQVRAIRRRGDQTRSASFDQFSMFNIIQRIVQRIIQRIVQRIVQHCFQSYCVWCLGLSRWQGIAGLCIPQLVFFVFVCQVMSVMNMFRMVCHRKLWGRTERTHCRSVLQRLSLVWQHS